MKGVLLVAATSFGVIVGIWILRWTRREKYSAVSPSWLVEHAYGKDGDDRQSR